jgi:hypothetical protein
MCMNVKHIKWSSLMIIVILKKKKAWIKKKTKIVENGVTLKKYSTVEISTVRINEIQKIILWYLITEGSHNYEYYK